MVPAFGAGWCPINLALFFMVGPQMGQELETGDVSISEGCVVEVLDVVIGDGLNDLGAKCFVHFVVRAEDRACIRM